MGIVQDWDAVEPAMAAETEEKRKGEKAAILKEAQRDNTTWPVLRFMCPILSYLTLEQQLLLLLLYC